MNRFGSLFKPLTWFMALVLAALVAGCGGGDDGGGPVPASSADWPCRWDVDNHRNGYNSR